MEGKTVILSVLIMSLLIAQIQVEARRTCCRSRCARRIYNACRQLGQLRQTCARISRCRIVFGNTCPSGFPSENLENSGDAVNEYCNLGCESSVCGALTTIENFDTSEIVNEALEECTKECSTLCATGFKNAPDQITLDQIAPDKITLDQSA